MTTLHQNNIVYELCFLASIPCLDSIDCSLVRSALQVRKTADGKPSTIFTTAGLDGRIITWDLKAKKHLDLKKLKLA